MANEFVARKGLRIDGVAATTSTNNKTLILDASNIVKYITNANLKAELGLTSSMAFDVGADTGADQTMNDADTLTIIGGNLISTAVASAVGGVDVTINHDTVTTTPSSNSSTTVLTSVTTDAYGHLTAYTTNDLSNDFDNYQSWTAGDGTTSLTMTSSEQLNFIGSGSITVTAAAGSPNTITIYGTGTAITAGTAIDITSDVVSLDIPSLTIDSSVADNDYFVFSNNGTATHRKTRGQDIRDYVRTGLDSVYVTLGTTQTISGSKTFTQATTFQNDVDVTGDLSVTGNMTVNGTASFINSTNVYLEDKLLTLASGSGTAAAASGAGIEVDVGSGPNVSSNPRINWVNSVGWVLTGSTPSLDVYGKLYIRDIDLNASSNQALVRNGNEIEYRTLGSLAFSSATYDNYQNWAVQNSAGSSQFTVGSTTGVRFAAGTGISIAFGTSPNTITITNTDPGATYTAGNGISLTGTTFAVAGNTGLVQNTDGLSIDYAGTDNAILAATDLTSTAIATSDVIWYSDATDNNIKKGLVSDLPFSNNSGTVTSVGITAGTDITVSGSPITTSGNITVNHGATGGASNVAVSNTNGSVIQSLTLNFDARGHATTANATTVNLDGRYYTKTQIDSGYVTLTSNQTITGGKTFQGSNKLIVQSSSGGSNSTTYINNTDEVTILTSTTNVSGELNYKAVFYEYVIYKGTTDMRAGIVTGIYNGSTVEYTETSTLDIGDTSDITLSVAAAAGGQQLRAISASATGFAIKVHYRTLD